MRTKSGQMGPILDIFFICTKIKGNIVKRIKTEESMRTSHQGRFIQVLISMMPDLMMPITGSKGLKIKGISDKYLASKSINLS